MPKSTEGIIYNDQHIYTMEISDSKSSISLKKYSTYEFGNGN